MVNKFHAHIEVYFDNGAGIPRLTQLIAKHLETYPKDTRFGTKVTNVFNSHPNQRRRWQHMELD